MKIKLISLLISLYFSSFGQEDKYKVLDQKKVSSSIKVVEGDEFCGSGYIINQTIFEAKYINIDTNYNFHIIEKKIEEKGCLGWEKSIKHQDVKVYNFDELKKPILSFKKECDEVYFHDDFFETITYGCCAEPNEIKLFDFKNRPIISGQHSILFVNHDNKELLIGLEGFEGKMGSNFKDTFCLLNFYLDSLNKWEFLIKNSDSLSNCLYFFDTNFPDLRIEQDDSTLSSRENPIYLFDKYYLRDKEEKFKIKLVFKFYPKDYETGHTSYKTIEIPFNNFKPYGKDQQKYVIDLKDL